jgi:hypothetical protein
MYKGDVFENQKVTYRFIIDMFLAKGHDMPSVSSLKRHYERHFIYYLKNRNEIPDRLIIEYTNSHRLEKGGEIDIDKDFVDEMNFEADEQEITRRMGAVDEGAKIYDVFPPTWYNSTTGDGGSKLTWRQWAYKFLWVKVDRDEGSERVRMVIPQHVEDLLNIIDKYDGLLLLIARNHLKSTILQIYAIRKLCDFQLKILYVGETADIAKNYTENIRTEIKENSMILLYYGYLPHPLRGDSKKGLHLRSRVREFDKDPHLSYASPPKNNVGTSKLGGHYDIILCDDLQSEAIRSSENMKQKHEDWFDTNLMPMRKGRTKLVIAGTRKDAEDIYGYVKLKGLLIVLEKPAIIKYPNGVEYEEIVDPISQCLFFEGGQMEAVDDDVTCWSYHKTIFEEKVGNTSIRSEIYDGVIGLRGGEVFWDEFRKDKWDNRPIKYLNLDGSYDKTRMTLQELLLEKHYLEAKPEKGHFSFLSEYQLNPVETKGKHFDMSKISFFDRNEWTTIVEDDTVPKYTWIDVGYSLPDSTKRSKDTKKKKTVLYTAAYINNRSESMRHYTESQNGVYMLEARAGNYLPLHPDPAKSLLHQIVYVKSHYKPLRVVFEDNYFGKFIRINVEMMASLTENNITVEGKKNDLDKVIRVSNGVASRLSNKNFPFRICKESLGASKLIIQMSNFPYINDFDELDAMESCDRLLISAGSGMLLINTSNLFNFNGRNTVERKEDEKVANSLITESPFSSLISKPRSWYRGI